MSKINLHKYGFHRYTNTYKTYNFKLRQYEFKYCSCGKWKHNHNPTDALKYPDLNGIED